MFWEVENKHKKNINCEVTVSPSAVKVKWFYFCGYKKFKSITRIYEVTGFWEFRVGVVELFKQNQRKFVVLNVIEY